MAVDKRILFGSLAVAVVISVAGGYALSSSDERAAVDDEITISSDVSLQEPGLGNALVEGRPLPDVTVHDARGAPLSTATLIGTPLLINVWATNCAPCKEEMPALAAVEREYGDRVRFIGLNQVANGEAARAFAADKGVDYELMSDDEGEFVAALGVTALPYTVLVASDGTIVAQKGVALTADEIRTAVQEHLLS